MSKHPHYEVRLADTDTLETISFLKKARTRKLSLVYNRPGQFDTVLPIDSPPAMVVQKHSNAIVVERDGEAIWSGPIFAITDDAGGASETTSLTANGWMEELNHRQFSRAMADAINPQIALGTMTGGQIANKIVELLNGTVDSSGFPSPTHINHLNPTLLDTQVRQRSYQEDQNAGAAITELIDIENGMDVYVHPLLRRMSYHPPQLGANSLWKDRPDVHFAYNMAPHNIAKIRRVEDGMRTANALVVNGANGLRVRVDSPTEISRAQTLLEETISIGDVNDANILAAYANAELVFRARGSVTVSMQPKSVSEADEVYRPFEHFNLGDQIYVSANRGRLQLRKLAMRVFGFTIDIDDNGNEIVSEIQATAS